MSSREKDQKSAHKRQTTFGMIKPEAFDRGLVPEIERRIADAGLTIFDKKVLVMDEAQFETLYGHVKARTPEVYRQLKEQMRSRPVEILEVEGPDAVERLLRVRGSSDPADALPGSIRGDFAKDQGYDPSGSRLSLNVFHAADSADDAERMRGAFSECMAKADHFYSESTRLYVSRKPLKIDARVKEAAERCGLDIDYNDEGIVNSMRFDDAKRLISELGSEMLSPDQYWKVVQDAAAKGDSGMAAELASSEYTEWLDRVYFFDAQSPRVLYINHPTVAGRGEFGGEIRAATCPDGRPGWFSPEGNINPETGEPLRVERSRERSSASWKYWSPELGLLSGKRVTTAPIRGYVTSVDKPSLDLGIPIDSRQPNSMVRECRKAPLESAIDPSVLAGAERVARSGSVPELVAFVSANGRLLSSSHDSQSYRLRESFFDALGYASLGADVSSATGQLCGIADKRLEYGSLRDFLCGSRARLLEALERGRDVVFVMGHKNPDTDTVVSAVFEAWRNHLLDGGNAAYVPIVQGSRLPAEIAALLGELSPSLVFSADPLYKRARDSGLAQWISVDQNSEPEVQKHFIAIIDHHSVSRFARQRDVPKTLEPLGSCCALVALKYLGMGTSLDPRIAAIMYGATLMDTENRSRSKMTEKDAALMDYLKRVSGAGSDTHIYRGLMSHLLEADDAELLFNRDYKEDGGFGFAVAKTKGCFSKGGELLKGGLVGRLRTMAGENNRAKNLPLTLLRVTDYCEDNETVNRERTYLVFNDGASASFREAAGRVLDGIIHFELPEDAVLWGDGYVDFWGSGRQLSRKRTAPVLEPVVSAFNTHFYSPSIGGWVKRDFLKLTREVGSASQGLSEDRQGRINNITFPEAKALARRLGFRMLSASEYWKVLADAERVNDRQMAESLRGSNFLEFWDSVILDKSALVDHPDVGPGGIRGERRGVYVPEGSPGLIRPEDIDPETGIPLRVGSPGEYGNPGLWRYWAPDSDEAFPVRSYIFLLKQPAWDGKFHREDSFPNLGIRPVVEKVTDPKVGLTVEGGDLVLRVTAEGDERTYRWPGKSAGKPRGGLSECVRK